MLLGAMDMIYRRDQRSRFVAALPDPLESLVLRRCNFTVFEAIAVLLDNLPPKLKTIQVNFLFSYARPILMMHL
jgi:hypothetical protein